MLYARVTEQLVWTNQGVVMLYGWENDRGLQYDPVTYSTTASA